MNTIVKVLVAASGVLSGLAAAQSLDPALLSKPLGDSWPTYSGDYSGKRYSSLNQINQSNVKNLTLAWVGKVTAGIRAEAATIIGGEGSADAGGGRFPAAPASARRSWK